MSRSRLAAAIVGLGQVGLLFDEEPQRRASGEIWTHFSAFERLNSQFDLVAAVEPDLSKRPYALRRAPALRIYSSVAEMLGQEKLDVISVCTPETTHLDIVSQLLGHCQGIFLEKPLCTYSELTVAESLIARIQGLGISVRVNYYKREETLVRHLTGSLVGQQNATVTVKYSGPFPAVGSHAINLLLHIVPDAELKFALCHPHEEGDGFSGVFQSAGGYFAQVLWVGPRHRLQFSVEVTTDRGVFSLERNLSRLRTYKYSPSKRYNGYEELEFHEETAADDGERFTGFMLEIAKELAGGSRDYASLNHSLTTQRLMFDIERTGSVLRRKN